MIDARRRVRLPKGIELDADEAFMVRQGEALLLTPVPRKPISIDIREDVGDLKARAGAKAREDALERHHRWSEHPFIHPSPGKSPAASEGLS